MKARPKEKAVNKKENENNENEEMDFEARQNLAGFFYLLLKIDMRVNPHLYKKNEGKRNTNNTDKTK